MIDYDPHQWRDHLLDIKGSMVRQIFYRVLTCFLWSVAVVILYEFTKYERLKISSQGHVLIGLALSLLLVFRTNASYDRFWEGRKQWGSIINESRNLGRAAGVLLADAPDVLRRLLLWAVAFPHAAMHSLRGGKGLGPAADELPVDEVKAALAMKCVPLAVARRMTEQLAEARRRGAVTDYVQMALDQNVQLLVDYFGACERIHRTPLPFVYVVHLRRALILYCFTLPFALLDAFGWGTLPATLLISYTLYGIEEIGVEIEDPFGADDNDLPLERFCETIERDLRSLMETGQASSGSPPSLAS